VEPRRVAVLISGRGTNLQALLEACAAGRIPARIGLVVADREDAAGLERARRFGVPAEVLSPAGHPDREAYEAALDALLRGHDIELACLAGWMRILGRGFVERWQDRLLNIHPSLLPAFRGLETHERVLEAGLPVTGCTVHLVRAEVDAGPVLVQGIVPVLPGDTVESLRERVLAIEHRAYPQALDLVVGDRVRVVDGRVVVRDERPGERLLLHPLLRDWPQPAAAAPSGGAG
jgi:phosphoribosylglycinamide formyltransferase-1